MKNRSMALVVQDNKILMVKQKLNEREFYTIPGGGIESNETPEQAAVRELEEECGIYGSVKRKLCVNYRKDGSKEYVFLVEVASDSEPIIGSDPEMPEDEQIIKAVQWMKWEELSERDKAYLWSYGLLDVDEFENEDIKNNY